jgi:hypothetical protein
MEVNVEAEPRQDCGAILRVWNESHSEIRQLKDIVSRNHPAAADLKAEDLCDASFVDELERTGYIERLYAKQAQ